MHTSTISSQDHYRHSLIEHLGHITFRRWKAFLSAWWQLSRRHAINQIHHYFPRWRAIAAVPDRTINWHTCDGLIVLYMMGSPHNMGPLFAPA